MGNQCAQIEYQPSLLWFREKGGTTTGKMAAAMEGWMFYAGGQRRGGECTPRTSLEELGYDGVVLYLVNNRCGSEFCKRWPVWIARPPRWAVLPILLPVVYEVHPLTGEMFLGLPSSLWILMASVFRKLTDCCLGLHVFALVWKHKNNTLKYYFQAEICVNQFLDFFLHIFTW